MQIKKHKGMHKQLWQSEGLLLVRLFTLARTGSVRILADPVTSLVSTMNASLVERGWIPEADGAAALHDPQCTFHTANVDILGSSYEGGDMMASETSELKTGGASSQQEGSP